MSQEFDLEGLFKANGLGSLLEGFGSDAPDSGAQVRKNEAAAEPVNWRIRPGLIQELGIKERYDLESGGVSFRLENDKNWSTLKWDADIPKFFYPGMDADTYYKQFLHTLFYSLPSKIFGNKVNEEYALKGYPAKTILVVNEDREELVYKLAEPANVYGFAANFMKPDQNFDFRSLTVKAGSAHYVNDIYWLRLIYPERWNRDILPDRRGEMRLSVPMASGQAAQYWNKNVLEWVIGTHFGNYGELSGGRNGEVLAQEISSLVKGFDYHASQPQD